MFTTLKYSTVQSVPWVHGNHSIVQYSQYLGYMVLALIVAVEAEVPQDGRAEVAEGGCQVVVSLESGEVEVKPLWGFENCREAPTHATECSVRGQVFF